MIDLNSERLREKIREIESSEPSDLSEEKKQIIGAFKNAAKVVVAKDIWRRVLTYSQKELDAKTQDSLAELFEVSSQTISQGKKHGQLRLEVLVLILSEFCWGFRELDKDDDPMPSRKERGLEGQIAAVFEAKRQLNKKTCIKITNEQYISVNTFMEHSLVRECDQLDDLTDDNWGLILDDVLPKIEEELDLSRHELSFVSREQLVKLHKKWSHAISRVATLLPFDWSD